VQIFKFWDIKDINFYNPKHKKNVVPMGDRSFERLTALIGPAGEPVALLMRLKNRRLKATISRKRNHAAFDRIYHGPYVVGRVADVINRENRSKGFRATRPRKWHFPLISFIAQC